VGGGLQKNRGGHDYHNGLNPFPSVTRRSPQNELGRMGEFVKGGGESRLQVTEKREKDKISPFVCVFSLQSPGGGGGGRITAD